MSYDFEIFFGEIHTLYLIEATKIFGRFLIRPILQALEKKVAQKWAKNDLNVDPDDGEVYGRNDLKNVLGDVFTLYFSFPAGIRKKTKNDINFSFWAKNRQHQAKNTILTLTLTTVNYIAGMTRKNFWEMFLPHIFHF